MHQIGWLIWFRQNLEALIVRAIRFNLGSTCMAGQQGMYTRSYATGISQQQSAIDAARKMRFDKNNLYGLIRNEICHCSRRARRGQYTISGLNQGFADLCPKLGLWFYYQNGRVHLSREILHQGRWLDFRLPWQID